MVFNFFVGLADLYVAGFIGPNVQAAIGFVTQLFFIVIIVANAIGVGTIAMVSRAVGAANVGRAVEIARQSLIFGVAVAVFITAATILYCREIVALAGMPEEIRAVAEDFLRIFAFALGPNYLLIISNSVFRAAGDVKKPLLTMFFVSLVNIIGDFVLVFGIPPFPEMGYQGIAFSTASSFTAGMLISVALLATKRWRAVFTEPWQVSLPTIARIVDIGWPSVFLQVAWQAGEHRALQHPVAARRRHHHGPCRPDQRPPHRGHHFFCLLFALNMAASVLAGQNLGAGDPQGRRPWDGRRQGQA